MAVTRNSGAAIEARHRCEKANRRALIVGEHSREPEAFDFEAFKRRKNCALRLRSA